MDPQPHPQIKAFGAAMENLVEKPHEQEQGGDSHPKADRNHRKAAALRGILPG